MPKTLFPRAMSQAAVLARTVGECCEGQIPRPLGRCKLDTPLLAAGALIEDAARCGRGSGKNDIRQRKRI